MFNDVAKPGLVLEAADSPPAAGRGCCPACWPGCWGGAADAACWPGCPPPWARPCCVWVACSIVLMFNESSDPGDVVGWGLW